MIVDRELPITLSRRGRSEGPEASGFRGRAYNRLMAAEPKGKPRGPWTAEEVARNKRVTQIRVREDRKRGVSANLEESVALTRFANHFAEAFKGARTLNRALDPVPLLKHLHEHGVEHIIIGGLAVSAHGHVHATQDLDIVPSPSPKNLERLAAALADVDALDDLNVIQRASGIETNDLYAELHREALPGVLEDTPVRVCGLEHLLVMKRAGAQPQDLADLERLGED
jgi:hypothetical protein